MSPARPGELPIPDHFDPQRVGEVWRVPYERRAREAAEWRVRHDLSPSAADPVRTGLLLVDVQNTFCLPDFELFVGGRSGKGAVDDNRRLCRFIYRHLARITSVVATLDTHRAVQVFHALFLVDEDGAPPPPYTVVTAEDVASGRWRVNPSVAAATGRGADDLMQYLRYYTAKLEDTGRYALTIWPYHALLGGIGHALVPAVEEAVFFHSVARLTSPRFEIKGDHTLTESYSALGPEVLEDQRGRPVGRRNEGLLDALSAFDALIVAGQAKSHCVSWTVADLLEGLRDTDPDRIQRVYLLEDCTSPVVVPGAADYTEEADRSFQRFAEAGMHRVTSTVPLSDWPGVLGTVQGR